MSPLTVLILTSGSLLRCSVTEPETELTLGDPSGVAVDRPADGVHVDLALDVADDQRPGDAVDLDDVAQPGDDRLAADRRHGDGGLVGTEMLTRHPVAPEVLEGRLSISMMLLLSLSLPWSTRSVTPSQVTFTGSPLDVGAPRAARWGSRHG